MKTNMIMDALKGTCTPSNLTKVAVKGAVTDVALTIIATVLIAGVGQLASRGKGEEITDGTDA